MPDRLICKAKVPVPGSDRMMRWCGNGAVMTEIGPRCDHHSPPPKGGRPDGQRIRAIMLADALTLTREERHEVAEMLVGHKGSWSNIGEAEARRIGDALEGFPIVQAILYMRANR